jgi:competence ComEA-like helix-hairpin-helix protein
MPDRSRKVNLNSASVDEITKIPGITYEHAQSIVEQRPFRSLDDLKKVRGLSDEVIRDIRDSVTL